MPYGSVRPPSHPSALLAVALGCLPLLAPLAAIAAEDLPSVQAFGEIGGPDVVITTHADLRESSIDIADNGDIYVAVGVYDGIRERIRVYWSRDQGSTWQLFGTLEGGGGIWYGEPSLHIGEGTVSRVYVACVYQAAGVSSPGSIRVAHKPLGSPATAWTETTALSSASIDFRQPSLHSSEDAADSYTLFLVAQAIDGNGHDIWFTRSTNQNVSWATGYSIAVQTSTDQDCYTPTVRYGRNGIIHCAYLLRAAVPSFDNATRYRRALNNAATSSDWQPVVLLNSASNGQHEGIPHLATSLFTADILVTYDRSNLSGLALGSTAARSSDAGATWPTFTTLPPLFTGGLTLSTGGDFVLAGESPGSNDCGIARADIATPTVWSAFSTLVDRDYPSPILVRGKGNPAMSPAYPEQAAVIWSRINSGMPDTLFFDAEWRRVGIAPGFPVALPANVTSPPAICELDGDLQREIVFGDALGNVCVYNHDGTVVPGWPQDVGSIPFNAPIAVGDLDFDGWNEVVVATLVGQVHAFRHDGTIMAGFPHASPTSGISYVSLGRFGPENRLDIVVVNSSRIYKLRHDAVRDPNVVVQLTAAMAGPAAIGDVDDDGDNEYVVLQAGQMTVVRPDGSQQASRTLAGKTFQGPAALADLNLDGDLEILAATAQGDVYVMNASGSDFPGWPNVVSAGTPLNSPIAADVVGSGAPEVFWSERTASMPQVHGFSSAGAALAGYPVAPGDGWTLFGSPIVDRMSGNAEVFLGSRDGFAYSWSDAGALNPHWPIPLAGQCEMSPASGDLDNDGTLDLVFTTVSPGQLCVVQTFAPLVRTQSLVNSWWPMYGYNPERQFCLACSPMDQVTAVIPAGTASLRLAVFPNPARRMRFAFELPRAARARLEVFDVGGRLARTVVDAELPAGAHEAAWDARSSAGARAAAGVYFARLTVPGEDGRLRETTRRVVLLP